MRVHGNNTAWRLQIRCPLVVLRRGLILCARCLGARSPSGIEEDVEARPPSAGGSQPQRLLNLTGFYSLKWSLVLFGKNILFICPVDFACGVARGTYLLPGV